MTVAVASLSLIATYFLPIWFIYLIAPQYPEGLTMNIWLYQITGQVEIINGLNHYIGMKHIKAEMFPEFSYLVYIMGAFIVFGLTVAISGRIKMLAAYLITLLLAGIAAMVDFYQWSYDYGHNLDPTAAIQIPGFSYQPPLFGHKTLLNFDAYSYPDTGGWIVIAAAGILFITWILEWRRLRKAKQQNTLMAKGVVATLMLFCMTSCSTAPEPIAFGKDQCADCKMTIMDAKFAAEIVTKKGKAFKFDDAHCVVNFLKNNGVKSEDVKQVLFLDFENSENFLDAHSVSFVSSSKIKSPMNGQLAAFPGKTIAEEKAKEMDGQVVTWDEYFNRK